MNVDGPCAGFDFYEINVKPAGRIQFAVDQRARDPISESYRQRCYPGSTVAELVFALLRPGSTLLDLGAHIGTISIPAAGAGCRVVAVEASPANFAVVAASAHRNSLPNLTLVHAAVSDRAGTVSFNVNGPWGHVQAAGGNSSSVAVRAVAVDDLLTELAIEHVDVIKMDIEGSECSALAGMQKLLAGPSAPPMVFESNGHTLRLFNRNTYALRSAVERLGYQLYQVGPARLVPVRSSDPQPNVVTDYLAAKQTPSIPGWTIDKPLDIEQLASQIHTVAAGEEVERIHVAFELKAAAQELRRMPVFADVLQRLRHDPSEQVRSAAA
jgi:FkbM family methyltransferase